MNNEMKGIRKRNAEYVRMANRKRKIDEWVSDYWYERYTRYIRTDRLFWETPELNLAKTEMNQTMMDYAQSGVPWPLTTAWCMTDYLRAQVRGGLANALREWNALSAEAKENLVVYFVRQYKAKFYTKVTGKVNGGQRYDPFVLLNSHGFQCKTSWKQKTAEEIVKDLENMIAELKRMAR